MLFVVFPDLPIGGEMLDVKRGYTFNEAMVALDSYGESGRRAYVTSSILLDTLFPIIYVTFYAGLIYRFRISDRLWTMAYIPFLAGACDLLENVQIIEMLLEYPEISFSQVTWASTFTQTKHALTTLSAVFGLVLLVIRLTDYLTKKIRSKKYK